MKIWLRWVLVMLAVVLVIPEALFFGACAVTERFGDLKYSKSTFLGRNLSPGVPMDPFWLPAFPIDQTGRHEFKIDRMPQSGPPGLPQTVRILAPSDTTDALGKFDDRPNEIDPPWKSVELRISVILPDGTVLGSSKVVMERMLDAQYPPRARILLDGKVHHALEAQGGKRVSYRIVVEVIHPSTRRGDRAFLAGETLG